MNTRALNLALTAVTGSCLAGTLAAGVAAASNATPDQTTQAKAPAAAVEHTARHKGHGHKAVEKAAPAKHSKAVYSGKTKASYFWDDGSSVNGDTGAPASGKPMQKGLFASPSWPLNTKVKVSYNGRSVTGFVGDRGPGEPSHRGVMLDLDTYTFRHLVDGKKPSSKYDTGTSQGHINGLKYEVLKWGKGGGAKGAPKPLG
ncbi:MULTISPECIES: hypothetical protein [Actinomadura]|uniref:Lipoprotein n=1 Tax=Actinomadura yumaensis TaxID=111807 RepID=A0ABW2CLG1_9ACTN|nr:hypothetical protein [Actinomadura sp. J1-007]MWK36793.1 hypothetical protein [Actinomadura sp. J1-007]